MNEIITKIEVQVKNKNRANVFIENKFCCGLSIDTIFKYNLKVGTEIDEEKLKSLQFDSEKNTALSVSANYISRSMKTEKDVKSYLSKKGYTDEVVEYVLEKLKGYDYISDEKYGMSYAKNYSSKKGKKLIGMELKQKGLSGEDIEKSLNEIEDESCTIKRLLEKYMKNKLFDKPNLQKAFKFLHSKGFDYEDIQSVMRDLADEEIE